MFEKPCFKRPRKTRFWSLLRGLKSYSKNGNFTEKGATNRIQVFKTGVLTIAYWLFAVTGYCQGQPLALALQQPSPFITRWLQEQRTQLALPDLQETPTVKHVRLTRGGQVLDYWQTPAGEYQGQVLLWVEEAGTPVPTHRIYSTTKQLPASTVAALFHLTDSTHILTVPTEEALAKWQRTLDGVFYTIEQTGPRGYRVQSWANPQVQESLPEALAVSAFITRASTLTQTASQWQAFAAAIPYPCYSSNGGSSVVCRITPAVIRKQQRGSRKRDKKRRTQWTIRQLYKD